MMAATPPSAAAELATEVIPTPLGAVLLGADDEAVRLLLFVEAGEEAAARVARYGYRAMPGGNRLTLQLAVELVAWFAGERLGFSVPVAPRGTPFQQAVWAGLARIPYGTTCTYGEQAAALGRPEAVRAVARANGANPVAMVLPCHRVVGAGGRLTGYAAGLERKAALLAHEARHAPKPALVLA